MPEQSFPRRPARLLTLLLAVAGLGLAACGGSSGSASSSVSTQVVGTNPPATTASAPATNQTASASATSSIPAGETPHHLSPQAYRALSRYAACIRSHGVNLPPPSREGNGPIFDLSHVDAKSPKFHAAVTACKGIVANIL
jgi:hypothetical protein